MLNIQHNRLNYGRLLAPPDGFDLVKAVGTTYSLDLHALLAIPVSMFYSKSMEGDFSLDRYDVLDAIRKSKEKVDLFCQRGKIKVPKDYHSLFAFMEDCVIEKNPDEINSAFHPKLWVLRFERKKEVIYRLIVLSRNLTFDRSWDVAYYADGKLTKKKNAESDKISTFIKTLYATSEKKIEDTFLTHLSKVEFDLPGFSTDDFFDFESFPVLPKHKTLLNPIQFKSYDRLLVISPFVNKTALNNLKNKNKDIILISRKEELDRLDVGVLKGIDTYCLKDLVVSGEEIIGSEEASETQLQNLHAKLFIGENSKVTDWFMGSANCTTAALYSNTELLVKVSSFKKQFGLAKLKKNLLEGDVSYFEKYEPSEIEVDVNKELIEQQIRELTFHLCALNFIGTVENSENENKLVKIVIDLSNLKCSLLDVYVKLPHKEQRKNLAFGHVNTIFFENVPITKLSKYLEIQFYNEKQFQKGIFIQLEITIPAEREDLIFKSLINSKDKFYKYLQFLLSPQDLNNTQVIDTYHLADQLEQENSGLQQLFGVHNPIYEALMLAASRNTKKLTEINKIIEKLQKIDNEIVADFLPIWVVFKEFAYEG